MIALPLFMVLAGEPTSGGWALEPRAFVGAHELLGDPRRLARHGLDVGVGLAVGRSGGPFRGRATFEAEPLTDIGEGASLSIFRARLGVDRVWRDHLVTAFDADAALRRVSAGEDLTTWRWGADGTLELGWRFALPRRWALTPSLRYTGGWFSADQFGWHELGLAVGVERRVAVAR
jgi:hypothetical protein